MAETNRGISSEQIWVNASRARVSPAGTTQTLSSYDSCVQKQWTATEAALGSWEEEVTALGGLVY